MIEYAVHDGCDADHETVEDFVGLVRDGGAVDEHFVRRGVRRTGTKIILARFEGAAVGAAALKVPLKEYRNGIESEAKSGHPIPEDLYPFELGYVAVSKDHGGRGIGRGLVNKVLELSEGHGIFATTSHPAMKENLLPEAGFEALGAPWANAQNQLLHLFVLNKQRRSSGSGVQ